MTRLGTVRGRLTFAALACLLLLAAIAGGVAWHRQEQRALDKNPSYQYGVHVMRDVIEFLPGTGESARTRCSGAVATSPTIPRYSAEKALAGCLDEDLALNR